jgi:hypothetical protein
MEQREVRHRLHMREIEKAVESCIHSSHLMNRCEQLAQQANEKQAIQVFEEQGGGNLKHWMGFSVNWSLFYRTDMISIERMRRSCKEQWKNPRERRKSFANR